MKKILLCNIILLVLLFAGCASNNNRAQAIEDGAYYDDMGSELIMSHDNGKIYSVDFGVYKVTYMQGAIGEYDTDEAVLHFIGNDDYGKSISADVRYEDGRFVVTIVDWEYEEYLPNGTKLIFYKQD